MRLFKRLPKRKQPVEERPVLQLPLIREPEAAPKNEDDADEEKTPRGVAIIDFFI